MEDLFQMLSSSARINKKKSGKRKSPPNDNENDDDDDDNDQETNDDDVMKSRDRTGKRDTSVAKQQQVHREQMAAFRRSMSIRLAKQNKHDDDVADPIASFHEIQCPPWWDNNNNNNAFSNAFSCLSRNIESGHWKEPTPIQMQSIPVLMDRRDLIACAPTGSGKSGAFLIPALLMSKAPTFYNTQQQQDNNSRKGEIRSLILAPSRELASQLHREADRLGHGMKGFSSLLLARSNVAHVVSGSAGGRRGLDVLVATPLRLLDAIVDKGLSKRLSSLRILVMDEADRLLDGVTDQASGSSKTRSFLEQMDTILECVPATAVRALFSATVTPMVRSLGDGILRRAVDVTVGSGVSGTVEQELVFVGREEGKLLAMRQLQASGGLSPPTLVFVQSQERAQALFGELLYRLGATLDVLHAGRSVAAREKAVANFRKGDVWLLICTDLMARGVDFSAVRLVINYDLPTTAVDYIHRIGRTGRAGRSGRAITFFTETDTQQHAALRSIANTIQQQQQQHGVPQWILQHKTKKKKKKQPPPKRPKIDTTPSYDKIKRNNRAQSIQNTKRQKQQDKKKTDK